MNQYQCSSFCSFYQGGAFIEGYIANILRQDIFEEIEFIFLDCDSPDNEAQYILPLTKKFKNVKYYRLDKDPGLYAGWNTCIRLCESNIVTNWNIDDRKPTWGISKLLNVFSQDPSIDIAWGVTHISYIANETWEANNKGEIFAHKILSAEDLWKHNAPHCMPMWNKNIHSRYGVFDERCHKKSDSAMWIRATELGAKFQIVDTSIGLYYRNPEGRSDSKQYDDGDWQGGLRANLKNC